MCVARIGRAEQEGSICCGTHKKRKHWPKHTLGDDIAKHFADKDVGAADAWAGELEGTKFHMFSMKQPNYVMSSMLTYGTLN